MVTLAEAVSGHRSRRIRYDGLCDLCVSAISAESEKSVVKRSPVPRLRTPGRGSATGITTTYTHKPNASYLQTVTSVASASSVVNLTDHGSMNTDQKTIGISERLFIDHHSFGDRFVPRGENWFLLPDMPILRHRDLGSCPDIERSDDAHGNTWIVSNATGGVVETLNYYALGNALGFSAATALTTYLYSSMPFDAASGNYYDHARFYDSGTGGFIQSDYGYSGSLANPMTDLPYAFTGGDPISMLDLSGHDFGLASFEVSFSIQAQLSSIDVSVGATAQLALQGFMQGQTSSEIITEFFIGQLFGAGLVAAPAFLDSINGAIGGFFRAEAESGAVAGAPLDGLVSLFSSVDITDQMSADAANSRFMSVKVGEGKNLAELVAPYRSDTLVAEARTTQALRLVRSYNPAGGAAQRGGFMSILDQVRGLTPEQIQNVLSLPYVPTTVTDVNVPVGTNIAFGTTSAAFGGMGGGLRVELLQQIPGGSFANARDVSQLLSGW